jgi:hypothetical protein
VLQARPGSSRLPSRTFNQPSWLLTLTLTLLLLLLLQVLYGLVGGVFGAAMYSTKRVLLNNEAGA